MSTKKFIKSLACNPLVNVAKQYNRLHKIAKRVGEYNEKMHEELGRRIAEAYELAIHQPYNLAVRICFHALTCELRDQYSFLIRNTKLKISPTSDIPYRSSLEMVKDVFEKKHLLYQTTESAFGEGIPDDQSNDNILLAKSGFTNIKGDPLLYNDLFRIVHDLFGHAKEGNEFGPIGEDKAWWSHYNMFSPLARVALTTELRGQNTWVNFGPHLARVDGKLPAKDDDLYVPLFKRKFAEQKLVLLPAEFTGVEIVSRDNMFFAKTLENWNPLTGFCKKQIA